MKMELLDRKRISIIVEETFLNDVLDLVRASGAAGFTVYRDIAGTGSHGIRGSLSDVNGISKNVDVVTIVDSESAERVLQGAKAMSDRGVILFTSLTDAQILKISYVR